MHRPLRCNLWPRALEVQLIFSSVMALKFRRAEARENPGIDSLALFSSAHSRPLLGARLRQYLISIVTELGAIPNPITDQFAVACSRPRLPRGAIASLRSKNENPLNINACVRNTIVNRSFQGRNNVYLKRKLYQISSIAFIETKTTFSLSYRVKTSTKII